MGGLLESSRSKARLAFVVTQDPYPDVAGSEVVKKMKRETLEIATPEATGVEVANVWIRDHLFNPRRELQKKRLREVRGYRPVVGQGGIHIRLHPAMKPNFHDG
jgi:hypothetical protein